LEKPATDHDSNRNTRFSNQSKNSGVKYETTMLAPARRMPSVASKAMVFKSNTPALAAAQIMAYSPLTWYAATGKSLPMSFASLIMSRSNTGVVQTAILAQDTTVTVAGVLAKTHICSDEERRESLAQQADGSNDRASRVVGGSAQRVFCVRVERHTEQDNRLEALCDQRAEEGNEFGSGSPRLGCL
ncbi:hypothetical protein KCU92_g359, partial [Aureobasidium melanogenum]